MKLKIVRWLSYVCLAMAIFLFTCAGIWDFTLETWFLCSFFALIIGNVICISLWKCLHCGKSLGRIPDNSEYCKHCGEYIYIANNTK